MRKLAVDMVRAADLLPAGNMLAKIPPAVAAQVTRDMTVATAATDSCNSCERPAARPSSASLTLLTCTTLAGARGLVSAVLMLLVLAPVKRFTSALLALYLLLWQAFVA
jgi:hypothetical protein